MEFIEYRLSSEILYLGERTKAEIFKPCVKTLPFSQISGALNAKFGSDNFKAVGYLTGDSGYNNIEYMTYAPRDKITGVSKLPLQAEFLSNVSGRIFVLRNGLDLPDVFKMTIGGLKSKGFGNCSLKMIGVLNADKAVRGILNVRIPIDETTSFNIRNVIKPVYGYLFNKMPNTFTGNYVLSFFEGSEVVAPEFLLKNYEVRNG